MLNINRTVAIMIIAGQPIGCLILGRRTASIYSRQTLLNPEYPQGWIKIWKNVFEYGGVSFDGETWHNVFGNNERNFDNP